MNNPGVQLFDPFYVPILWSHVLPRIHSVITMHSYNGNYIVIRESVNSGLDYWNGLLD